MQGGPMWGEPGVSCGTEGGDMSVILEGRNY